MSIGPRVDRAYAVYAEAAIAQYLCVKKGSAEHGVVAATAGTDLVLGAIQNASTASGDIVRIPAAGEQGLVRVGGNVAMGDYLVADTDSMAIASTTADQYSFGRALQTGVDGNIITYEALSSRI